MNIFLSVQRNFAMFGMNSRKKPWRPFKMQHFMALAFILTIISNGVYLLYVSNDYQECLDSLIIANTAVACALNFLNVNSKLPKMFQFMENLETIVQESE